MCSPHPFLPPCLTSRSPVQMVSQHVARERREQLSLSPWIHRSMCVPSPLVWDSISRGLLSPYHEAQGHAACMGQERSHSSCSAGICILTNFFFCFFLSLPPFFPAWTGNITSISQPLPLPPSLCRTTTAPGPLISRTWGKILLLSAWTVLSMDPSTNNLT